VTPAAVFVAHAELRDRGQVGIADGPLKIVHHLRQVGFVNESKRTLPDKFLGRVAQHARDREAVVFEQRLRVQNRNDVEGVFRQRRERPSGGGGGDSRREPVLAVVGLAQRATDRRDQPLGPVFQHVIGRAGLETLHRGLFADGSRDEQDRNAGQFFPRG